MSTSHRIWIALDRASLVGIAVGLAIELQPFFGDGLRVGFFVTLAAVVLQIASSHVVAAATVRAKASS